MSKTQIGRINRAIFGERFSRLYDQGKSEGKWKTQEEFGQLFDPHASRGSVMKWCSGKNIPKPETIKRICEIFGVPEDYFDTDNATREELYRHSPNTITLIGKKNYDFAKNEGLNLEFIDALSGVIDFNSLFPLYSPIPDRKDCIMPGKREHSDSASIEENLSYMQIERDGKKITLHPADLAYLKEVQDQIIDFVEFLFFKRSKEMKEEALSFNRDFLKAHPQMQNIEYKTPTDFYIAWDRSAEENEKEGSTSQSDFLSEIRDICQKHDRFMYVFQKEVEKRKATQEDIDRFFGKGKDQSFTKDGVTYTKGR